MHIKCSNESIKDYLQKKDTEDLAALANEGNKFYESFNVINILDVCHGMPPLNCTLLLKYVFSQFIGLFLNRSESVSNFSF